MRRNGIEIAKLGILLVAALVTATGCASLGRNWKSLVGGTPANAVPQVATPRFSEIDHIPVRTDRQYRRMSRDRFEDEAELSSSAGSLWVMEGQGAYLFSQNQMRVVGDLLNVRIEGNPKSQLHTKVRVISRLLEKLDNPRGFLARPEPANGRTAPSNPNRGPADDGAAGAALKDAPAGAAVGAEPAQVNETSKDSNPNFAVDVVPTRIVEQLKDGSYRVRGIQPFMIGKREYKVIVTGVVRSEDFDDAGIDASRLLDPQFDIVSSRKGANP